MQLRKLKNLDTKLADTLLTFICKAANPGAIFIFIGTDWLRPKMDRKIRMLASVVMLKCFPQCILLNIKTCLVFKLLKYAVCFWKVFQVC